MKAILRSIRISPKKANLIAALVRNKSVKEAVDQLRHTQKKAAPLLRKLIESAAANAVNNFKQNNDNLFIKEIVVTEGPTYKRNVPISRGRAHPILKRTTHITVKVEARTEEVAEAKVEARTEEVAEAKVEAEPKKESTKK